MTSLAVAVGCRRPAHHRLTSPELALFVRGRVEATTGFEPVNRGFADPTLTQLHAANHPHSLPSPTMPDAGLAVALAVAA